MPKEYVVLNNYFNYFLCKKNRYLTWLFIFKHYVCRIRCSKVSDWTGSSNIHILFYYSYGYGGKAAFSVGRIHY